MNSTTPSFIGSKIAKKKSIENLKNLALLNGKIRSLNDVIKVRLDPLKAKYL